PLPLTYPLSLHDALPISAAHRASAGSPSCRDRLRAAARPAPTASVARPRSHPCNDAVPAARPRPPAPPAAPQCPPASVRLRLSQDRKSTRLNSSHLVISY